MAFTLQIGGGSSTYNITFPSQIAAFGNISLSKLISNVVTALVVAAVVLSFIFLLIGGVKWILSQGDKKQLESAQKTILYAIIGLIVVLLSFFIINLIGFVLGGFNLHLLGQ